MGFQVRRYLPRRQEVDEWAWVPRTAGAEVSRYGRLVGPGDLGPARLVQIWPYVLTRLTLPGSLFLAAVAVAPSLFIRYGGFSQANARALGGTSVLIAVGVALDTMRQMESQMMMRNYEGFLR